MGGDLKKIFIFALLLSTISLFAVWNTGEPITDNYSWTDSNHETHSIDELIAAGKAIIMFWGTTG